MYISPEILSLIPYKPGKPIAETQREFGLKEVVKLASNENALGLSPKVVKAVTEALQELHRYPDPSFYDLKKTFAEHFKLSETSISFGNGSNEIIDLLIRLFCEPGHSIIAPKHSFVAYKVCAQVSRVKYLESAVDAQFRPSIDSLLQMCERDTSIKMIFLANPNNPTGVYIPARDLQRLLETLKSNSNIVVVADEAYTEFVRASDYPNALELLQKYKNFLVIRTFSKAYGMAGLRLGALLADPQWIDLFNRIRNPFNVNHLAQVAAVAGLDDKEHLARSQKLVWDGLDYFYKKFSAAKISYVESQGNFLLVDCQKNGQDLFLKALKLGLITRPVDSYGLPNYLRITVGTQKENELAFNSIEKLIHS